MRYHCHVCRALATGTMPPATQFYATGAALQAALGAAGWADHGDVAPLGRYWESPCGTHGLYVQPCGACTPEHAGPG